MGKSQTTIDTSGAFVSAGSKTVTLKGFIALDVEAYLKDSRIVKILADNGLTIEAIRIGSRKMAAKVVANLPQDFFFPSGIVGGTQIGNAAKIVPVFMVLFGEANERDLRSLVEATSGKVF